MNVIEVVDVPHGASEDEARRLLNGPCEVNRYMLVQVLPVPNGARAFYRLVASAYDKKPGERNGNRDGKDDAARAVLRANPDKSIRQLVDMLADLDIKRGRTWVSNECIALRGAGSKLESA